MISILEFFSKSQEKRLNQIRESRKFRLQKNRDILSMEDYNYLQILMIFNVLIKSACVFRENSRPFLVSSWTSF